MYDIKIRFPTKAIADEFCAQMSDGFGEGFCSFSHYRVKPNTDGSKPEHYEKVVEDGVSVYFVDAIFDEG